MKLSAKTEYGCVALMHLAGEWATGEPVQLRRIAEEHGIPQRFLVQIMLQLKSVGLVRSIRGAGGGYRLSKPPRDVSLLDVIVIMDGDDSPSTCCGKESTFADSLLELRRELCRWQRQRLESTTLADLAEKATAGTEPMWYI